MMTETSETFKRPFLAASTIVASNDINEDSLHSIEDQVCLCFHWPRGTTGLLYSSAYRSCLVFMPNGP